MVEVAKCTCVAANPIGWPETIVMLAVIFFACFGIWCITRRN